MLLLYNYLTYLHANYQINTFASERPLLGLLYKKYTHSHTQHTKQNHTNNNYII